MAIETDFWDNKYNNPALTTEMVIVAEKSLGIKLPLAFINLLKISNGGFTKGFVYPVGFETSWGKNNIPLHELFGIVTDKNHETSHNILCTDYMTKEWGLPEKQVLLSGDGHTWVSLDYRSGDEPSIRWIDVESNVDRLVADNFIEFLDGLVHEDDCIEY